MPQAITLGGNILEVVIVDLCGRLSHIFGPEVFGNDDPAAVVALGGEEHFTGVTMVLQPADEAAEVAVTPRADGNVSCLFTLGGLDDGEKAFLGEDPHGALLDEKGLKLSRI